MKQVSLNNKMLHDIESNDPDVTICHWNIERLKLLTILLFLMQTVNILNRNVYSNDFILNSVVYNLGITIIAMGIVSVIEHFKDSLPLKFKQIFCTLYWMILPSMTVIPFLCCDVLSGSPPINFLLVIGFISVIPILTIRETVLIFSTLITINAIISLLFNPSISLYLMYSFAFSVGSVVITAKVHKPDILLIKELAHSNTFDYMTGILSKRSGIERTSYMFHTVRRYNRKTAVYMIDVDFFKQYNDKFGHPAGDEALKQIANVFSSVFSRDDDIIFRYGGEEFIICVNSNDETFFRKSAFKLLEAVESLHIKSGSDKVSPYVTISIGCAIHMNSKEVGNLSVDYMIEQADLALYEAKRSGRNQVCFNFLGKQIYENHDEDDYYYPNIRAL